MKSTDFAKYMTGFLSVELPAQQGVSSNTIKSYRDTFALLLRFCHDVKKLRIEKLSIEQFDANFVVEFLNWLESERGNSVATRNQRLSALHAFFRYLQKEEPGHLLQCKQILDIGLKKHRKPHIEYLSAEQVKTVLAKPDLSKRSGRRDLLILCLLYDTGARVSELIDLNVRDVRLEDSPIVTLSGKGNKSRQVPLMTQTAAMLRDYLRINNLMTPHMLDHPLFFNNCGTRFTRPGITYILKKYCGDMKVTPHTLRHTKAMHLLQAGVNIVYIRDILGHVDLKTTEVYARADTEMKRAAMQNVYKDLLPKATPNWNSDATLMQWLHDLV
jgi:site-specific recombinase XerD